MGNPVVHFDIIGKDAKALGDFYRAAFDWEVTPFPGSPTNYALVKTGDGGMGGGIGACPQGTDGHVTVYVHVADVANALERITELGGTVVSPPQHVPGGPQIAFFRDPQDHLVGLVH